MASSLSLLFLSLLTISPYFTTATTTTATTTLDVAAAIQATLDALNPTSFQQAANKTPPENTSASLSFTLHPRSSIAVNHHHHRDYESLTLARLTRDSIRANSIITKLEFAISGTNYKSEMKSNTMLKPEDVSAPVTSGLFQAGGEYLARVGLGTPPQLYYMMIDTGSDVNWIQCQPCDDCYEQTDPIFRPSTSSSYNELPCISYQCLTLDIAACRNHLCEYQISYGDGSFSNGRMVTETVTFGKSGSIPKIAMGCGHDNEGLFLGAAGLLALGGGHLSLPSQIKATSFSYCLVDRDSKLASTLDFNSVAPPNSITAPLLQNPRIKAYLYVGLTGISVGGFPLSIPSSIFTIDRSGRGGAIVDSGTTVTHLQNEVYKSLRYAFLKQARDLDLKRAARSRFFDTCFDFSSERKVDVPTVEFDFVGGKKLWLKPGNFMYPVDSRGTFCLAFVPSNSSFAIIGNFQQQGMRVGFDLGKSVVSFTPRSC